MTCPSFAKSVPIGLRTIGAPFCGTGVGVGSIDDVDKDTMLVGWPVVKIEGEGVDNTELVTDGEISIVVVVASSAVVVTGGGTHIKSSTSNPVTIHTSSGSLQGLGSQDENGSSQRSPVNPGRH